MEKLRQRSAEIQPHGSAGDCLFFYLLIFSQATEGSSGLHMRLSKKQLDQASRSHALLTETLLSFTSERVMPVPASL
jgi:hypothetical protein